MSKKQRRPRPETWLEAIQILTISSKLHNGKPLTTPERLRAASALVAFVGDEQNGRFWKSVANRPANQERAFHCVLDIVIDLARGVEEKAAKEAAHIDWRLSKDQIKHALSKHRKQCEALIVGKDLAVWRRVNDALRLSLMGKK